MSTQFSNISPQQLHEAKCRGQYAPVLDVRSAAERLEQAGYTNLTPIDGGTQRWQKLGLPVERCGRALSIERQVQIAIGSLLVLKVFLGFSVHELFFALTAMIGAVLIIAGTTRWCGMARLIAHMPWNRNTDCTQSASA